MFSCAWNFASTCYVWFVFAGGGGSGDMMEMVDTIFVSGLPDDIDEDGLVQHFGSIGVIKVCIRKNTMLNQETIFFKDN